MGGLPAVIAGFSFDFDIKPRRPKGGGASSFA